MLSERCKVDKMVHTTRNGADAAGSGTSMDNMHMETDIGQQKAVPNRRNVWLLV